ncbi:hypothetical protein JL720_13402 [Aureococcus anophagefferens]|nr:hypothetical protein JL720_13402 [Aureococcus anophagefferens]
MIATQTTAEACALAVLGLSGSGDAGAAHSAAVLGAAELRFGFNDAGTLTFGTMTIKNPGDLAARVVEGDTMLHVAVRARCRASAALLAPDARAPLGVRNARGETAFEVAVAGDAPAETKEDAEADADLSLRPKAPAAADRPPPPPPPGATLHASLAPAVDRAGGVAAAAAAAAARRRGRGLRGADAADPRMENTVAVLGRAPAGSVRRPPPGAPAPASRRSIEAIEDELRAATARCLAGDPTRRRTSALGARSAHPDFAVRRASKARWDRDERAANRAALKATRGLVPPDILRSAAAKVRGACAHRGPPGRYALAGPSASSSSGHLAALPRDFDNDGDGAKAAWREQAAKASKASKAPRVNHAPAPAPASEAARPKAKVLKASAAGGEREGVAGGPAPLDAGCHLIEMCTGKLVTYERKKAFLIAYAGLGKHKDGNRDNQGPTLLITLDAPTDYVGGGCAHPGDGWEGEPGSAADGRAAGKGCGVTFGPKIQHEGLRITAGRRHLLCIFPDLVPEAPGQRPRRDSQRHAALVVFGRLKKKA